MEASTSGGQVSGTTSAQPDLKSTGGPSGPQTGGGANTAPPAASTNVVSDWTSSLPDSAKLYVSQKGFKDPGAVLDSYQNLEKLMGAPKERLLRLPDKSDAPEWGEIYDKLGRPKAPTDYAFQGVKDASGKVTPGNPEFTSWAQKQFHDLGLTKAQGETLAAKWNEYAVSGQTKESEVRSATTKAEALALNKEWGAAHEQNIKAAQAAARQFGLGQAEVDKLEASIGFGKTMKFLAAVGAKVGEDGFVIGQTEGGFSGALTPEIAQAQIADLRNDKDWTQRYLSGETAAKSKIERLMKFAYPDLPQG